MRIWTLILVIGFAGAVIAPGEIGTEEQPAVGGRHLVVKPSSQASKDRESRSTLFVLQFGVLACSSGSVLSHAAPLLSHSAYLSSRLRL